MKKRHKKNLRRLASFIEAQPFDEPFDMRIVKHSCGTASCILGYAEALFKTETVDAAVPLGLHSGQDRLLFMPELADAFFLAPKGRPDHISRKRAVAQLRYIAETGEVDWSATP